MHLENQRADKMAQDVMTQKPAAKKATAVKPQADAAPVKRGRGRPRMPPGEALTPAERKKIQRERDLKRGIADQSVDGLLQSAGVSIAAGNVEDLKALSNEMVRRAKINSKKQR